MAGASKMITICVRELAFESVRIAAIRKALEVAGHTVMVTKDAPWDWSADEIVWIQHNASWFPNIVRALHSSPVARRPFTVIWLTEPLPQPTASKLARPRLSFREVAKIVLRDVRATDVYTNYRQINRLVRSGIPDLLAVSTPAGHEFLAEQGISSEWIPLGYSPDCGRELNTTRDIDVLFLGAPHEPRHTQAVRYLRSHGVDVLSMGGWNDPRCWGEPRTRLLNRTKILLNLQRHPGMLSGYRLMLGMGNNALVVSEPVYDSRPFISGEHFLTATLAEMPAVISRYLGAPASRDEITRRAFQFVTQHATLEFSIGRICELITTTTRSA